MTDIRLYTLGIAEGDIGNRSTQNSKRVSSQSSITNDFGDVQGTGAQPGARPLTGAFKGQYSEIMAKELQELAQSTNYGEVVYISQDNNPLNDTYVTVDSFDVNPASPRVSDELWEFSGTLTDAGTNRSHFRAVKTQPVSIDNPFDASGTDLIGIPATATKVSWYDEQGQTREDATVQNTLTGRFIDVDVYDPDEPSFSNPTLIAKVPYADEGKMDARVWDDFDRARLDGEGVNSWQKVFATGHNFDGSLVIENGLIRVFADEDAETLSVERYDGSNYTGVSLGTSDWTLTEINLTRISPSRVEGQMRFRDTVGGGFHTLDYQVNRASDSILFVTPSNEGSIPAGLSTLLSPVAEDWSNDAQAVQNILSRREVNN